MMLDSYFRPTFQRRVLDPLLAAFGSTMHPNLVTLTALLCGVSAAIAVSYFYSFAAVCLLLLSGLADVLDGSLARRAGESSPLGAVLDIVSDRIVEGAVILGLFCIDPEGRGWLCLFMLFSVLLCITSFLVVGVFTDNMSEKGFYYSPGLIERTEAFAFFIVMIVLPSQFTLFATLFCVLVLWTALWRVLQFSTGHKTSP